MEVIMKFKAHLFIIVFIFFINSAFADDFRKQLLKYKDQEVVLFLKNSQSYEINSITSVRGKVVSLLDNCVIIQLGPDVSYTVRIEEIAIIMYKKGGWSF
jgi:hypothetical protein